MESLVHGMVSNAAAVALLAVPIVIVARLARRPALVHGVCLLALLKLVTPPVLPVPIAVLEPAPAARVPAEPEPLEGEASDIEFLSDLTPEDLDALLAMAASQDETLTVAQPPAEVRTWSWERPALLLILAGTTAWWGLALVRIVRFHRALGDARPMPANGQAEVEATAARIGLRRAPRAFLVPGDVPPMIWAVGWRARLLVPVRLWDSLDGDERSALLLHELAHLKRRDHWLRWAELAIAGLYWWNPALWWLRRALREAEEQCCDAWVVWAMPRGGARTYASALVAALEFVSGSRKAPTPAAAATLGNGHVSSMKRRLRMIVKARTPRRLSWPGKLAVACVSALLLPLGPSWAQKASGDGDAATPSIQEPPATAPAGGDHERRRARDSRELLDTEMQLIEARAALDATRARLKDVERDDSPDTFLEVRIAEEFKKAPEARELVEQIEEAKKTVAEATKKARNSGDPSVVAASNHLRNLNHQWHDIWEQKHDEIAARLRREDGDSERTKLSARIGELETTIDRLERKSARLRELMKGPAGARRRSRDDVISRARATPDQGDQAKGAQDREAGARLEAQIRELKDKLARDLDPLGDAIRKELDRTLESLQQALEKDRMTPEDLRRAMEKSRKDLRESFRQGGPLEKSIREAAERARQDLRETMERSLDDARRQSEEALDRFRAHRDEQAKHAAELAEQHRRRIEEQRKAIEERRDQTLRDVERLRDQMHEVQRQRKEARKQAEDQARERSEQKPGGKPPTADATKKPERPDSNRAELDAARKEIADLRLRLLEANRQLRQLQHPDREIRRPDRPDRPRAGDRPAAPAPPDRPAPAARPAEPAPSRDDYDRRFRELDDK
ncbi:MAG: M56 family metallopeptidase, partial [Isosphaeraceae bacterium]